MNCALPFCAFVGLNLLMGLSNGTVKGTPSGGVGLCDMKRSAVHIRQGFYLLKSIAGFQICTMWESEILTVVRRL